MAFIYLKVPAEHFGDTLKELDLGKLNYKTFHDSESGEYIMEIEFEPGNPFIGNLAIRFYTAPLHYR